MEMTEKHVERIYEHDKKDYASKGVAGTALGLGIAGTALGLGLFGGNGCGRGLNLFGNNNCGCNTACAEGPSAFAAWTKECEDNLELTRALYRGELRQQEQRFSDRQTIDGELFGLYKSQIDADFNLYKGQRDNFDALSARINDIEKREIANSTALPYQLALVDCKINNVATQAENNLERRTCRMIQGIVGLPQVPTSTVFPSYNCCCGGFPTPPAPSTPSA